MWWPYNSYSYKGIKTIEWTKTTIFFARQQTVCKAEDDSSYGLLLPPISIEIVLKYITKVVLNFN